MTIEVTRHLQGNNRRAIRSEVIGWFLEENPGTGQGEPSVALTPCALFYMANPDVATLRLSFAASGVNRILEGLGRLGKAS